MYGKRLSHRKTAVTVKGNITVLYYSNLIKYVYCIYRRIGQKTDLC